MPAVWLPMFLFALTGAISPGPVNLIASSMGAQFGLRRALCFAAGATLSYALILLVLGSGMQALLARSSLLGQWLPCAGAAYLLVLAWRIATQAPTDWGAPALSAPGAWTCFVQGLLTQALNPKAWLVALSGIGLFAQDSAALATLVLISVLVCFASELVWAVLGKLVRRWLQRPRAQVWFNRTLAALLAYAVLGMLQ